MIVYSIKLVYARYGLYCLCVSMISAKFNFTLYLYQLENCDSSNKSASSNNRDGSKQSTSGISDSSTGESHDNVIFNF